MSIGSLDPKANAQVQGEVFQEKDAGKYDPKVQPETGAVSLPEYMLARTARVQLAIESAHGNCYENECYEDDDSNCASCQWFDVYLPLGSQVKAVRYYSTAGYPNDVPIRQVAVGEQAWAYMSPATIQTTASNVLVRSRFFNRSHNRARVGALEVDWD